MAVGISGGSVPFWVGVLGLALVIGVYETLGGLRSVAWTDAVQAILLLVGFFFVLFAVCDRVDSLTTISERLLIEDAAMVAVPTWSQCGRWASSIVLLGLGAAVYPHALQRIYAARDSATLRSSMRVMVCMPLLTTSVAVAIGILAHGLIPPRSGLATDRVLAEVLAVVASGSPWEELLTVLVMTAALAAMMSTADSALLSLSSMVARDWISERRPDLSEAQLATIGKVASWVIIACMVALAVRPPTTLWRLIEIKMELLIQVAPVVILGVRSPDLDAASARTAVAVGAAAALLAFFSGLQRIGGVHAGTYACVLNFAICWLGIRRVRRARRESCTQIT